MTGNGSTSDDEPRQSPEVADNGAEPAEKPLEVVRRAAEDIFERTFGYFTRLLAVPPVRTGFIIAAVFVLDFFTALGVTSGVLYVAAVLSAVPIRHARAVYATAAICTALVMFDWVISASRGETEIWKVVLNRALTLGVIWTAAAIVDSWRRLQQRRSQATQESRLLHQATALSASQVPFRQALQESLKSLCEIFDWPAGHVYWRDRDDRFLIESGIWHLPGDGNFELLRVAAKDLRFGRGDGVPGQIWETGQPLAIADVSQSRDYAWLKQPERLGVAGAFAAPIIVGGKVAAVLEFFWAESTTIADREFLALARNIGQQLGRLFERRRAEDLLRENEERLRLAMLGAHLGTWEWQIGTNRVIWSPEFERIHGLEPGAFKGTFEAFQEDIHPDDRQRVIEQIRAAAESQEDFHVEYRCFYSDKTVRWLEGRGAVHTMADGKSRRMIGVCTDVTERKLAEQQLKQAKEAAESANSMRSQFVANVSHELRTPMNSILGMLQLALGEANLSAEVRPWLETAEQSSHSLLVLLNDLLDFSKLEAGKVEIAAEPFRLRETIEETVEPLAPQAFEKRIELIYEVVSEVPDALVGDARRVRQVLTNLLANAIKFTESGEVVLRVELHDQPTGGNVRFTVSDTGVGISPDDQERIFEPFAQCKASSTRQSGGVGLGLAIANEFVRRMGGKLSIESEPGNGSRFSFTIPFAVQSESAADLPSPSFYECLRNLPVLVVDDNETSRQMLGTTLQNWGLQPDLAIDAEHALGKLHRAVTDGKQYSLIVLDGSMPGMSGFDLAERIAKEFQPSPPVMLMLAAGDRRKLKVPSQPLVACCLEKPVSPSHLLGAVVKTLNVQLPSPEASKLEPEMLELPRSGKPLSILVAEDTPANQEMVVSALRKRGHTATVARHGGEAVELWKLHNFDVLLMDVEMPVLDGYEATAAIRKLEQQHGTRIPIIGMTAHAMSNACQQCLDAGMDDYLAKPIEIRKLVELVENYGSSDSSGEFDSRRIIELPPSDLTDEAAVMDYAAVMKRLAGDEALFWRFVEVFEEDAPRLLDTIHRAVDAGDAEALRKAAHSMRGLAANFDAHALVDATERLELLGQSQRVDGAREILAEAEQELERLKLILQEVG